MIKALIPVNTDLKSSIALRYANALSQRIELMLHDIHIVESDRVGPEPGSGWVRNTWENALIETADQEIRQFLEMENLGIKRLGNSEIVIGDRTEKLLETLEQGKYQLFMEGALPSFNLSDFTAMINSRLYRAMPCPAMVVKNLVPLDKVTVLVENGDYANLLSDFLSLFASSGVELDLVNFVATRSGDLSVREPETPPNWLTDAAAMLSEQGVTLNGYTTLEGSVIKAAQHLRAYGLVAASMPHHPHRHDPKLELLARVSSPVLICWSKS